MRGQPDSPGGVFSLGSPETMAEAGQFHPKVFISYSHRDERWKDRLLIHMRVLQREAAFDIWDDRRLRAGDHWYEEIQSALRTANLAILLISANSLTSDFILREEVRSLLQRHEREGLRIIPIVLEPCAWQKVGWLSKMQLLPKDGRPLSQARRRHEIEAELTAIATLVFDLLREATFASVQPSRPAPMPSTDTSPSPAAAYNDLLALAATQQQCGQYSGAQRAFEKAISILGQLVERSPAVSAYRSSLAVACNNFGNLLRRLGRLSDAKDYYHRALDLEERLHEEEPDSPDYLNDTARTHHNLGTALWDEKHLGPAAAAFRRSVEIRAWLVANTAGHPRHCLFRRELGDSYTFLGKILWQMNNVCDAEAAFRHALHWLEPLVMAHPAPIEARMELGLAYAGLARLLAECQADRRQEAEALYAKALTCQHGLVDELPTVPDHRHHLAFTLGGLARLLQKQEQRAQALDYIRQAIDHGLQVLESVSPQPRQWHGDCTRDYRYLLAVLLEMGNFDEAATAATEIPSALRTDPSDCIRWAAFLAPCVKEWVKPGTLNLERNTRCFENLAMEQLREAVDKGHGDPEQLLTDKRFEAMRSRADFHELITRLRNNSAQE